MSIRSLFFGRPRSVSEEGLFHNISLVAILAWVGLGADGLSSSCYGPEETFKALGANPHLALFVAVASVVTIVAICASYSQTIALFPSGGGGYLVASKLLSPAAGVVSGGALLVDYVLTITISIASGADALFSLLPAPWLAWKLVVAYAGVVVLTLINLRGVKESVMLWVPVFFLFVATHAFAIVYAISHHAGGLGAVALDTAREVHGVSAQVGLFGLLALILRAYSLGAGTYTGIEAVSNGLPILREPRVHTGRVTMVYMGVSLAVTVAGLLVAYLLYHCEPVAGKTLNAVLFAKMTAAWPASLASGFVWVTLASEAVLLFIAAQAGFVDGPRVLANMALDRWLPTRFANLSDRLVTQNGILLMGVAALLMMLLTRGSVDALVVLYSINVFLTFTLSQLGMVVHWWQERRRAAGWLRKLAINGFGFVLTAFILGSLVVIKFAEGAWVTVLVTGALIAAAFAIRRHYRATGEQLRRLDVIVDAAGERASPAAAIAVAAVHDRGSSGDPAGEAAKTTAVTHRGYRANGVCGSIVAGVADPGAGLNEAGHSQTTAVTDRGYSTAGAADPGARTAVVLVNGFNGLGLHTVLDVPRLFGNTFRNFVFISVGAVDAGNFKGADELEALRTYTVAQCSRYAAWARAHGFGTGTFTAIGHDVIGDVVQLAKSAKESFPNSVFFAGQLLFAKETWVNRVLHNSTAFALQRRFFLANLPFVLLPIRVEG